VDIQDIVPHLLEIQGILGSAVKVVTRGFVGYLVTQVSVDCLGILVTPDRME